MLDQFVVMELQYVFGIDALETSRPITLQVTTPEEISSLFDAITYDKGTVYYFQVLPVLYNNYFFPKRILYYPNVR